MSDRSQRPNDDRGDDRKPITSARHAAEALFAPKRQITEQLVREAGPPTGAPVRKPRVLSVSATVPSHHQDRSEVPAGSKEQVTPKIPRSQFARIRAWQRYGMTAQQVAEVYGVTISEIEGILAGASGGANGVRRRAGPPRQIPTRPAGE